MKTQIFNRTNLNQAADLLKAGQLVAFPTETVYGLGAICTDEQAVNRVFQAKGRPSDNPLIVHVASQDQAQSLARKVSHKAQALMDHFWPGPLTIIFPVKPGIIAANVTGGKNSVAIRMPDQNLTLQLIKAVGIPLVGPSANLSGKPSPTSLAHVLHDFDGKIAGVLENTSDLTQVGVESTVVYPHDQGVDILRPGLITAEQIQGVLHCSVNHLSEREQLDNLDVASPGVKYTHYSPSQPVALVEAGKSIEEWRTLITEQDQTIGLLVDDELIMKLSELPQVVASYSLGPSGSIQEATRHLYAGLRYLDDSNCQLIFVQGFTMKNDTFALMNRIRKASSFVL